MKRVMLKGVHSKKCVRCKTVIKPEEWCWRKLKPTRSRSAQTVYYCDKCGEEIQI